LIKFKADGAANDEHDHRQFAPETSMLQEQGDEEYDDKEDDDGGDDDDDDEDDDDFDRRKLKVHKAKLLVTPLKLHMALSQPDETYEDPDFSTKPLHRLRPQSSQFLEPPHVFDQPSKGNADAVVPESVPLKVKLETRGRTRVFTHETDNTYKAKGDKPFKDRVEGPTAEEKEFDRQADKEDPPLTDRDEALVNIIHQVKAKSRLHASSFSSNQLVARMLDHNKAPPENAFVKALNIKQAPKAADFWAVPSEEPGYDRMSKLVNSMDFEDKDDSENF